MNAPLGGTPQSLTGLHVVDAEGAKVGLVQQVYRDDATNEPEWITVRTGLFGMKETFVPLAGARRTGEELHVPHTKSTIKQAPRIDAEGHLDPSEEERLYRHYGLIRPGATEPTGTEPMGTSGTRGMGDTAGAPGAAGTRGPVGEGAGQPGRAPAEPTGQHRTRADGERNKLTDARTRNDARPMAVSRGAEDPHDTARSGEQLEFDTEADETGGRPGRKGTADDERPWRRRDERGGPGTDRPR
ncbi:PRC-barrel domain-containing protein [Streptomyces lunalinharesii]|uniref:PRC-barrel domain-containing protein n=1 Tax=Streptomyces lunalinharesii TaxID=333384 RepID=A0ABN3RFS2_9ACTN